jgi:hypothetical protein
MRRYWQVERLMGGFWLPTDFRVGGAAPEAALADAKATAPAGWEVRLGREVRNDDHYCDFAWVNMP